MARYLRRVTSFTGRAGVGSAGPNPPPAEPLLEQPPSPAPPDDAAEMQAEAPKPPRPRGRPRLEDGEDRKPMGHRVPAALLRQLTLVAAELAYLEDRKVQQQDLVAMALEEFIARQRIRIEELRRQRSVSAAP